MTIEKIMSGTYREVQDMMEAMAANRAESLERVDTPPSLIRGYVSRKTEAQLWVGTTDHGRREYWVVKSCPDNTMYFVKSERWVVSNMFTAVKVWGNCSIPRVFANLSDARRWARGSGYVGKLHYEEVGGRWAPVVRDICGGYKG